MRNRIRDNRHLVTGKIEMDHYTRYPTCSDALGWYNYWTGNYSYHVGSYETMRDVVTPDWNKKRGRGEIAFNPMSQMKYEIDAGLGDSGFRSKDTFTTCSAPNTHTSEWRTVATGVTEGRAFGFLNKFPMSTTSEGILVAPYPMIDHSTVADMITEASTACRADRGTADSNQWEATAEFHKSLALGHSALAEAEKFLRNKSRILERAKAAGNAWLLYRYGFIPLMLSVESATQGVLAATGKRRITSRSNVTADTTASLTDSSAPYGAYTLTYRVDQRETVTVRAMSLDEQVFSLANNIGFTSKGLMQLPWELVPYSFVVDWFANIGDFYSSLLPVSNTQEVGSCYTVERRRDVSLAQVGDVVGLSATTPITVQPSTVGWNASFVQKDRYVGLPDPGLVIRSSFKLDHTIRVMDSLSLLIQRLKQH